MCSSYSGFYLADVRNVRVSGPSNYGMYQTQWLPMADGGDRGQLRAQGADLKQRDPVVSVVSVVRD